MKLRIMALVLLPMLLIGCPLQIRKDSSAPPIVGSSGVFSLESAKREVIELEDRYRDYQVRVNLNEAKIPIEQMEKFKKLDLKLVMSMRFVNHSLRLWERFNVPPTDLPDLLNKMWGAWWEIYPLLLSMGVSK